MENNVSTGVISSNLNVFHNISRMLADSNIPILSNVANVASPFLKRSGQLAADFGFSKPISESVPVRSTLYGNPYMPNVDGVDASVSLSLAASNGVSRLQGFGGTDVDEMSLDYVMRRPAFVSSFVFSSGNIPGDILYGTNIYPGFSFLHPFNLNSSTGIIRGHLDSLPSCYLSRMFK